MELDDLKNIQKNAPFLFYLPREYEIHDISYRDEGDKWSTLRFFIDFKGNNFRVKEFFLDWFYTSFPKNLMSSFVESYSPVEIEEGINGKIFIGLDYKGMSASSCYAMGTQIEIEGDSPSYLKDVNNILRPLFYEERFRNYPFHERSFFARNSRTSWFEEDRIARMKWQTPEEDFLINDSRPSSLGIHESGGYVHEVIMIFSEDFFRKVFWVDIASTVNSMPNGYYSLRKAGNLFTFNDFAGGIIAHVNSGGPGIWQASNSKYIFTVSFSSDVFLQDIYDSFGDIVEIIEHIITKYF
ncbi:MAG: hypothetical protein ACP5LC_02285 [Thermoplasmata archaeon]